MIDIECDTVYFPWVKTYIRALSNWNGVYLPDELMRNVILIYIEMNRTH